MKINLKPQEHYWSFYKSVEFYPYLDLDRRIKYSLQNFLNPLLNDYFCVFETPENTEEEFLLEATSRIYVGKSKDVAEVLSSIIENVAEELKGVKTCYFTKYEKAEIFPLAYGVEIPSYTFYFLLPIFEMHPSEALEMLEEHTLKEYAKFCADEDFHITPCLGPFYKTENGIRKGTEKLVREIEYANDVLAGRVSSRTRFLLAIQGEEVSCIVLRKLENQ